MFVGALTPAGPDARAAADLWQLMLALAVPVFVLVIVLLVMAVRRRDRVTVGADPRSDEVGTNWVVLGGIALPTIVVLVVLGATLRTMGDTTYDPPPGAVAIAVDGFQYGWTATHTDGGGVALDNELVIPTGRPVALTITSSDVIHSFWVPQLAGKMDAIPERANTLVIEADEPGQYDGRCAEYCGIGHAEMPLVVVALDAEAYEQWRAAPGSRRTVDPVGTVGRDPTSGRVPTDDDGNAP